MTNRKAKREVARVAATAQAAQAPLRKAWERPRATRRPPGFRARHRLLIVCEDEKSGRYYLEAFVCDPELVEITTEGGAGDPLSVVEKAVKMKEDAEAERRDYTEVWAVFDRDSHDKARWEAAFKLAAKYGVRVAYANPCFELWYLLHFHLRQTHVERDDLFSQLKDDKFLGEYEKGSTPVYDLLEKKGKRLSTALKNSEKLAPVCGRTQNDNPSMTLHRLIERLMELRELKKTDETQNDEED